MDGQTRVIALIVAIVFLVGTATYVVSSGLFSGNLFDLSRYQSSERLSDSNKLSDSSNDRTNRARRTNRIQVASSDGTSNSARNHIQRLETILASKETQLNEKDSRLRELGNQIRQLESGRSRPSVNPVSPRRTGSTATPPVSDSASESPASLRAELRRLNEVLLEADLLEEQYRNQIGKLEDSLDRTNQQLELLEDGTDAEIANTLSRQLRREQILADFVTRLGPDSIPSLIQLLDQDDPRLRIWSAKILGRLGEAAESAVGPLTDLLDDRSAEVRDAAGRALDGISGR